MVKVPMGSTTMDLLPLLCLCVLTRFGSTLADGPGVLVAVQEGSDAILPCSISTKENIEKKVFDWKKEDDKKEVFLYDAGSYYGSGRTGQDEQFKDRVFHFKDELKNGNASIKITNTEMTDNGSYTCIFPKLQSEGKYYITLIVGHDPKNTVLTDRRLKDKRAVLKPSFKTLRETKDGVPLQCLVMGTSSGLKLNITLLDNSGTKLNDTEVQDTERGGIYILQTTVTKSDDYYCVATQEEIYHQVTAENYVNVPGGDSKIIPRSSSHVVIPWVISAVLLLALIVTTIAL